MSKIQLDQSMIVMSIFPIFTLSQKGKPYKILQMIWKLWKK